MKPDTESDYLQAAANIAQRIERKGRVYQGVAEVSLALVVQGDDPLEENKRYHRLNIRKKIEKAGGTLAYILQEQST